MSVPFTGGCLCGAVRYEFTGQPSLMLNCHCRDCQQATGSAYSPGILLPSESFKLTKGTLRYHLAPRENGGRHRRGFCAECGARITAAESDEPTGRIGVHAVSLDDPSWFRATMDIFTSEAQPWDRMDPSLQKFEQYPPSA